MLRELFVKVRAKAKYAVLAGIAVVAMSLSAGQASAQWGGYGGYSAGYGGYGGYGHSYHAPSVQYQPQFHGSSHWTPYRGSHSHGHIDYVPRYSPGHMHHYGH